VTEGADLGTKRTAVFDDATIAHCLRPPTTSTSPGCPSARGFCTCECDGCNGRSWAPPGAFLPHTHRPGGLASEIAATRGYESGVFMRIGPDGAETMQPARRYPDGRIVVIGQGTP
jgi:hypothetical protein